MCTELIVSCEHASNRVPPHYKRLFEGRESILATHRAYDPGSLELGRRMARACGAKLIVASWTRLLVDLNRSLRHPAVFSEFGRTLSQVERDQVLARYYWPHRTEVEEAVRAALDRGMRALHLSVHSFAPVLRGERRNADLGLLYDPACESEVRLCKAWQRTLGIVEPNWNIRRNYPYRGDADGLTTHLRRRASQKEYLGIEIEINQKFPRGPRRRWLRAQQSIIQSLKRTLLSR